MGLVGIQFLLVCEKWISFRLGKRDHQRDHEGYTSICENIFKKMETDCLQKYMVGEKEILSRYQESISHSQANQPIEEVAQRRFSRPN